MPTNYGPLLALEMMEHNITVNAYAPGLILTDMSKDAGLRACASDVLTL